MENQLKEFDCVEMKRRAGLRIHETLKGMTREERIEYWRKQDELFRNEYPNMGKALPASRMANVS
jgi:hypothetical protein